jgi:signal transduction histidine kinase
VALSRTDIGSAFGRLVDLLRASGLLKLPRFVRTSSFRLTLLYAALLGASVLVLFGIVYWLATGHVAGQIDSAVATEIAEEQADAGSRGPEGLRSLIAAQAQHARLGAFYLLQDASGSVLAGNLPPMRPVLGVREWTAPSGTTVRGRGVQAPDGGYLLVGLSDSDLQELRDAVAYTFFWVLAGSLALAFIGGVFMSFSVLGRVEAISRASRRIIAGDLNQRIALRGTNDEFDHLAASLNAMLDRIQHLMEDVRRVSSDIAHDLRTPLSRHRQKLELARTQAETADELRAALDSSVVEVDAILDTFGALLRIAKLESGADPPAFADIDFAELIRGVLDAYIAVAEEQGQVLRCSVTQPLLLFGSRELLVQLFANLLENALRHTPRGSTITLSAAIQDDAIVAEVRDNGPGIPPTLREAVFRPFYRLEVSRTTQGTGLGLSLVAAIAAIHGARVLLSDNQPGLCVTVRFGTAAAEQPYDPAWLIWVTRHLKRYLPAALAEASEGCGPN